MILRLPPLNPLRAFEATARLGSMSLAAKELFVTHSAISYQIRALEEALGLVLIVKGTRPLKLTAEGAILLPVVSTAFKDIATVTQQLKRPSTQGKLTIACVPGLLSFWLMPRLSRFTAQYPDVSFTITPSNSEGNLANPQIDICILYGDGNWPGCWVRLWSPIEFFPVASPTLLNTRPLRSPRDLHDHVILHGDTGKEWNTWLAAADINNELSGPRHFLSDARLSTEAALRGHGVALGDSLTASDFINRGELVVPFNLSVSANNAFYLACRNESRDTPIVRVFIDWMSAAISEATPIQPYAAASRILRKRARTDVSEPSPEPSSGQGPSPESVRPAEAASASRRRTRSA